VKLVFTCGGAFSSSFGGDSERSIKFGGCGNLESENVEGVVSPPLEGTCSVDEVGVVRRGVREFTAEAGASAENNCAGGKVDWGFGSRLIGFQLPTFGVKV
jgi:hypothetical protein